jgi:hypothetical protein
MKLTYSYVIGSVCLLLMACAHTRQNTHTTATVHYEGLTSTDANGNLMLLGPHPATDLRKQPFTTWFTPNYNNYKVDTNTVDTLAPLLAACHFQIFMGTWCGDSKREVPRMLKILSACQVPADHIQMVMVDNRDSVYKQSPTHEEAGKEIHHVPDLLVLHQGIEVGRIVERPLVSLEKDLLCICKGEPYATHYPDLYWLSAQFKQSSLTDMQFRFEDLADTLRPESESVGDLAAYSRILLLGGDTAKAVFASRLNTAVYPKNPYSYYYLARTYTYIHDLGKARQADMTALAMDSTYKPARDWLKAHP